MRPLSPFSRLISKVGNTFLIIGGFLLLLFGVSKVPHFGGTEQTAISSGIDGFGGIANAETSGDGCGDGSSGDSSSGGG